MYVGLTRDQIIQCIYMASVVYAAVTILWTAMVVIRCCGYYPAVVDAAVLVIRNRCYKVIKRSNMDWLMMRMVARHSRQIWEAYRRIGYSLQGMMYVRGVDAVIVPATFGGRHVMLCYAPDYCSAVRGENRDTWITDIVFTSPRVVQEEYSSLILGRDDILSLYHQVHIINREKLKEYIAELINNILRRRAK